MQTITDHNIHTIIINGFIRLQYPMVNNSSHAAN